MLEPNANNLVKAGTPRRRLLGRKVDTLIDKPTKRRLLLIGPKIGKTVMGVSVAFDMLSDFLKSQERPVTEVNLTQKNATTSAGRLGLGRAIFMTGKIVEAWCKMLRADVVYLIVSTSNGGFAKDLLIILIAWLLRCRVILHLHGGGYLDFYEKSYSWMKWLIRWTLSKADKVIVLGDLLRKQFGFLDRPEMVVVVPNGLPDTTKAHPRQPPKRRPEGQSPWRILYLSNLMETKGYFLLAQAAELLRQQSKEPFTIDFCGAFVESVAEPGGRTRARKMEKEFRAMLDPTRLGKVIKYHGTVHGETKDRLLSESHFFVLPTTYPWEGQPISIIEAMAHGLLSISTNHAGIPEQVAHEETGLLLTTNNLTPQTLADALQKSIEMSPQQYHAMSEAALKLFNERFTGERHLDNMLKVIDSV